MLIIGKVIKVLKNKRILLILKVSISFGILYWILTNISFANIGASLSSAKISFVLIAILLQICTRYIAAHQMKLLTSNQGLSLSTNRVFEINFITCFYELFLPSGISGGVIKWHKFSRPDKKKAEAFTSIVFYRLFETIMIVFLGITFFILDIPPGMNRGVIITLLIILMILLIFYFLAFNAKLSFFLWKRIENINLLPGFLKEKLYKLYQSLKQIQTLYYRTQLLFFLLSLISYVIGTFSFLILVKSLGIEVSFVNIGWIRSFISIVVMLPISISGLGVREGALIVTLNAYGITPTDAIAFSILLYAWTLFMGFIGGLLEAYSLIISNRRVSIDRKSA